MSSFYKPLITRMNANVKNLIFTMTNRNIFSISTINLFGLESK